MQDARTLPMSASAVVHRDEALELLQQLRARLRDALSASQSLLDDREGILAQGRQEVERLRAEALAERDRLVAQTSVHQRAADEAARLLGDARDQAAAMRAEVEDYVDQKLANFEVVLARTLEAVQRGRSRLSGHSDLDDLR